MLKQSTSLIAVSALGYAFGKHREFRPEAIFAIPNTGSVQVLSDDGGLDVGGSECKDLDPAKQSFRSVTIDLGLK